MNASLSALNGQNVASKTIRWLQFLSKWHSNKLHADKSDQLMYNIINWRIFKVRRQTYGPIYNIGPCNLLLQKRNVWQAFIYIQV